MSAASVRREFSSAVVITRVSMSASSAPATFPEARRARVSRSPLARVSRRWMSAWSAASLRSAGTTGVSATRIRSKVNRWRTIGSETWRGVRGCETRASLTLRLFIRLASRLRASRAWGGRSGCFNRASARSSVSAASPGSAIGGMRSSAGIVWKPIVSPPKNPVRGGGSSSNRASTAATREIQSSVHRLNDVWLDRRAGEFGADLIVENLAHHRGVTKNASHHGHWCSLAGGEEAMENDARRGGEFASGMVQDAESERIAAVGGGEDGGEERGEIGGIPADDQLLVGGGSEGVHQVTEQRRGLALVVGAQGDAQGFATDPVSGTVVRDGKAPAAGAGALGAGVAAAGDGARASDDNDAGARAEGGVQGNFSVGDDLDFAAKQPGESAAERFPGCGAARTGGAEAGTVDVGRLEASHGAGLANSGGQGRVGGLFSHANHVASAGAAAAEDGVLVSDQAGCLAAAAVNTEEDSHGVVLPRAKAFDRRERDLRTRSPGAFAYSTVQALPRNCVSWFPAEIATWAARKGRYSRKLLSESLWASTGLTCSSSWSTWRASRCSACAFASGRARCAIIFSPTATFPGGRLRFRLSRPRPAH